MDLSLNSDCEKIMVTQGNSKTMLYNDEKIQIENQKPISFSTVATQKSEIWKHICKIPLLLIGAVFNILLMNFEWDWIDNFEPCTFSLDNYIFKSEGLIEIKYVKSKFNKEEEKIILPSLKINGKDMEIKSYVYTEDLMVRFFKCCIKVLCILIWCLAPLTIIMFNAGKYSFYVLFINICIVFSVLIKVGFEYRKYRKVKNQLFILRNKSCKQKKKI